MLIYEDAALGDCFRICHVTTRFLTGGGTRRIINLVNGLDPTIYELVLFTGRDTYPAQIQKLAICQHTIIEPLVRRIQPMLDVQALLQLTHHFRQEQYAIVHTHHAKAGVLGRLAARLAGIPIVVHTLHGSTFHDFYSPIGRRVNIGLEKFLSRLTTHYVSVSYDLRNSYLAQGIAEPTRYSVIRSGMDLDSFRLAGDLPGTTLQAKRSEFGLEADDLIVGYVGRFVKGKGHEYVIDAARMLIRQNLGIKFLFVGDGPQESYFRQVVEASDLDGSLIFAGYREDVAEIIASFDVMAFTSLWEGLSQVLVQAATVGKPIVTFDVGGAGEVVKDGVNGFIIPLKDVDQLVEKIGYLLSDRDRAREMGLRGRKFIDDSWSIETMVQQTDNLYQRLLRERGIN